MDIAIQNVSMKLKLEPEVNQVGWGWWRGLMSEVATQYTLHLQAESTSVLTQPVLAIVLFLFRPILF